MKHYPDGVIQRNFPESGEVDMPITDETRWSHFCEKGAAIAMAALMNSMPGIAVTVIADPERPAGYLLQNPGNTIDIYRLRGNNTITDSDGRQLGVLDIDEEAGSLIDRASSPSEVDRDPTGHGPEGGPNLHCDILKGEDGITPIECQFRWGA